jgi:hypothetical protein
MDSRKSHVFEVLQCFVLILQAANVDLLITYSNTAGIIESFPHDIPNNVEKILIESSGFTEVDYLEPFPALLLLLFDNTALSTFPDVSNVTATLEEVHITTSDLTSIYFIPTMSALVNLNLASNLFTAMPDIQNVGPTLESLSLANNDITVLGMIPLLSVLRTLDLSDNSITAIPDLTNVSSSLEELFLTNNDVIAVDSLPPMAALRSLIIVDNALIRFPDVRNASPTLTNLIISGSDITKIPNELVAPLVNLTMLSVGDYGNPIFLPNTCLMGRGTLVLELHGEFIACDWTAIYVKLAERAGKLVIRMASPPDPVCDVPPALSGTSFSDVTMNDLISQASKYIYHTIR